MYNGHCGLDNSKQYLMTTITAETGKLAWLQKSPLGSQVWLWKVAYLRGRDMYREAYEENFSAMDAREVTVRRVVNIVERSPMPREYEGGFDDDNWYGDPRIYQDTREYINEDIYPPDGRQYYDNPHFHRNASPPRNEGPYSQQSYSRHDLRHHLASRSRGRAGPYFRQRGRGSGPPVSLVPDRKAKTLRSHPEDHGDHKMSTSLVVKRGRSPGNRETQPPVRSGSNTSNKSLSPDGDKSYIPQQAQKKHKPNMPTSHTPSTSVEGSPHSSGSSKEKTPASAVETEEVVAASMEPKLTPDEDFKARRSEAIKAKAQEIERHYRQDCETFRTVVKMLVVKEPSLDGLLQAPLDQNLLEIKQRCLDDLRHFVQELDEMIARGGDEPEHDSPDTSTIFVQMEEDFPQLNSTNLTGNDAKQDVRRQPGNTDDSEHAPPGNQEEGTGTQTENMEESTRVSEIHRHGRQENLAISGPEQDHSEPIVLPSKGLPASAQQGPVKGHQKRLQLYGSQGEKLSNGQLSNPQVWDSIAYAKPGWVPPQLPFLQPGNRYRDLKDNSRVVSSRDFIFVKGWKNKKRKHLACRVISYIHAVGPWCEVHTKNGNICILAAYRLTAQFPGEQN